MNYLQKQLVYEDEASEADNQSSLIQSMSLVSSKSTIEKPGKKSLILAMKRLAIDERLKAKILLELEETLEDFEARIHNLDLELRTAHESERLLEQKLGEKVIEVEKFVRLLAEKETALTEAQKELRNSRTEVENLNLKLTNIEKKNEDDRVAFEKEILVGQQKLLSASNRNMEVERRNTDLNRMNEDIQKLLESNLDKNQEVKDNIATDLQSSQLDLDAIKQKYEEDAKRNAQTIVELREKATGYVNEISGLKNKVLELQEEVMRKDLELNKLQFSESQVFGAKNVPVQEVIPAIEDQFVEEFEIPPSVEASRVDLKGLATKESIKPEPLEHITEEDEKETYEGLMRLESMKLQPAPEKKREIAKQKTFFERPSISKSAKTLALAETQVLENSGPRNAELGDCSVQAAGPEEAKHSPSERLIDGVLNFSMPSYPREKLRPTLIEANIGTIVRQTCPLRNLSEDRKIEGNFNDLAQKNEPGKKVARGPLDMEICESYEFRQEREPVRTTELKKVGLGAILAQIREEPAQAEKHDTAMLEVSDNFSAIEKEKIESKKEEKVEGNAEMGSLVKDTRSGKGRELSSSSNQSFVRKSRKDPRVIELKGVYSLAQTKAVTHHSRATKPIFYELPKSTIPESQISVDFTKKVFASAEPAPEAIDLSFLELEERPSLVFQKNSTPRKDPVAIDPDISVYLPLPSSESPQNPSTEAYKDPSLLISRETPKESPLKSLKDIPRDSPSISVLKKLPEQPIPDQSVESEYNPLMNDSKFASQAKVSRIRDEKTETIHPFDSFMGDQQAEKDTSLYFLPQNRNQETPTRQGLQESFRRKLLGDSGDSRDPGRLDRLGTILARPVEQNEGRRYSYDHLDVTNSPLLSLIGKYLNVSQYSQIYSDAVFRVNKHSISNRKFLVIVPSAIVMLTPASTFFKADLKRIIPFRSIEKAIVSSENNHIVFSIKKEEASSSGSGEIHDEIIESYNPEELIMFLKARMRAAGYPLAVLRMKKFIAINSAKEANIYDFSHMNRTRPHLTYLVNWASKHSKIGFLKIEVSRFLGGIEPVERVTVLLDEGLLLFTRRDLDPKEFFPLFKARVEDACDKELRIVFGDMAKKSLLFSSELDKSLWREAIQKKIDELNERFPST